MTVRNFREKPGVSTGFGTAIITLLLSATASAQTVLSLEEAARRVWPSYAAAHAGARVSLEGTIAAKPVQIREYTHGIIQDQSGFGFTLEWIGAPATALDSGDIVRAKGVIRHRSGLVVLGVESVEKTGKTAAPAPVEIDTADLNGYRYLGRYVRLEAHIINSGQNAGGDVLLVGEKNNNVAVFWPRNNEERTDGLRQFQPGDKVLIKGISSQYCPIQPYDRGFQIIVASPDDVTLLSHGWVISPQVLVYGTVALIAIFFIWWFRERQAAAHRRVMRRMMSLSEELLTASSAVELAQKLGTALTPLLNPGTISLYVFNRGAKTLERVPTPAMPDRDSIDVDTVMGTLPAAAALCFRNRALLEIPSTRTSPLVNADLQSSDPRGALFVPLFATNEPVGVLAIHYRRTVRRLSPDQRTAMQHLGNLIAASLRLQEQRWMRDQLLRSEKMAAAGQLISGVANDLREPLTKISDAARQALQSGTPARSVFTDIDQAARHGVEIVQHLLAFSRMEGSEPRPLDVFALVSSLVEMRRSECALKGVRLETSLPVSPLQVVGDQAQLEQVFLTLLLHAEQTAAASDFKEVSVAGRPIGKRVLITISYSGGLSDIPPDSEPKAEVFDPRVCHALIQGHAGELRLTFDEDLNKVEVDLPLYQPTTIGLEERPIPARKAARALTALLVEPEAAPQRKIVTFLAMRDHRVIPVDTYDGALEAVQRFRFDIVLCADRIAGTTWVDFFQRVRRKVGAFVLVTDIEQVETGPAFKSGEAFVLRKPVDEAEFDNLLKLVESDEAARK